MFRRALRIGVCLLSLFLAWRSEAASPPPSELIDLLVKGLPAKGQVQAVVAQGDRVVAIFGVDYQRGIFYSHNAEAVTWFDGSMRWLRPAPDYQTIPVTERPLSMYTIVGPWIPSVVVFGILQHPEAITKAARDPQTGEWVFEYRAPRELNVPVAPDDPLWARNGEYRSIIRLDTQGRVLVHDFDGSPLTFVYMDSEPSGAWAVPAGMAGRPRTLMELKVLDLSKEEFLSFERIRREFERAKQTVYPGLREGTAATILFAPRSAQSSAGASGSATTASAADNAKPGTLASADRAERVVTLPSPEDARAQGERTWSWSAIGLVVAGTLAVGVGIGLAIARRGR